MVFRRKPPFSGRPQIWPCDWNTKYFPSGVHFPQHSLGGLCQPGSNGRRFVPSTDTSQSDIALVLRSVTLNRSSLPSSDHTGALAKPVTETSLLGSVPSLVARNR